MSKFVAVVAILFAATAFSAAAQTSDTAGITAAKPLTWDVISIKPHKALDVASTVELHADGVEYQNTTLNGLFLNAFEVRSENQIVGYPAWVSSEHFDIQAKMDANTVAAYHKLKGEESKQQWHAFMRQILEERFGLKFHIERRELPVYNLVIAKQGLKLKESAHEDAESSSMGPGKLTAHRSQVGSLASSLSGAAGRVILDKTGLTALYNIDLRWSPDNEPDNVSGPSIFTALQEQLGLKLEPAKAPIDVVVIDHLGRPSEN